MAHGWRGAVAAAALVVGSARSDEPIKCAGNSFSTVQSRCIRDKNGDSISGHFSERDLNPDECRDECARISRCAFAYHDALHDCEFYSQDTTGWHGIGGLLPHCWAAKWFV